MSALPYRDRRRRQYAPLSVYFAHGRTGKKLLQEFGHSGLLAWVGMIAAAKRSAIQGTIRYVSESDAWEQFGVLEPSPPDFPLDSFLRRLGQLKQTHRRRIGDVFYITLTRFGDWNDEVAREKDAEKKRRKRQGNTGDVSGDNHQTVPGTFRGTEGEGEGEGEESLLKEDSLLRKKIESVTDILLDLGDVTEDAVARLMKAYRGRDYLAEAAAMVNWTLDKGIERKNVAQAYGNWLKKAEPAKPKPPPDPERSESGYIKGKPGEVC